MSEDLTLEQRVKLIEWALVRLEQTEKVYVGLCLNAACGTGPGYHPHWDDENVAMVRPR